METFPVFSLRKNEGLNLGGVSTETLYYTSATQGSGDSLDPEQFKMLFEIHRVNRIDYSWPPYN